MGAGPNLKHARAQLRGLSRALKQSHQEQKDKESMPIEEEIFEEIPLTPKEKFSNALGRFMMVCTVLFLVSVGFAFWFPEVFDVAYENRHANDLSEAEVFLSNQHPELVPFIKVAQDAKYHCKSQTLRSCYLFLKEDAEAAGLLKGYVSYDAHQKKI